MKLNSAANWLLIFCSTLIFACNQGKKLPDVSNIEVSLNITRWDQEIFQLEQKSDIAAFFEKNPLFSKSFLHVDQYPHDSLAVNYLYAFLQNPGSQVLREEVDAVFGDLTDLQSEFEKAFKHLKYYYPDAPLPKIYTAITGFAGNDLLVTDSAIVIGLDYYLGDGATFRPLEFPNYILKKYRPEYIVPSSILLLSGPYNHTQFEDKTMLADMIYFGKAYYFSKQMVPNVGDSLLIGYSGQELSDAQDNQDLIWAHFIDNQLLYENSHFVKKKYMDERPRTLEIGDKCPGRIGEWLGWEIVKKFMSENQGESLQSLMGNPDAQQVFMLSKYRPQPL